NLSARRLTALPRASKMMRGHSRASERSTRASHGRTCQLLQRESHRSPPPSRRARSTLRPDDPAGARSGSMFAQQVVLWGITILTLTPGGPADSPESQPAKLPDFDALWDYSQPAATETKFREILPLAQESGDLSYRLQLETQIARALGLQQKFDEAHR